MKPLINHYLFYDENCPFCVWYSNLFIQTKMIDRQVRTPFSKVADYPLTIDMTRAKNQIPLMDIESGKVLYGIDALIMIFTHSFPLLQKLLTFEPIYYGLKFLYAFISYNRKIIFPYHICSASNKDFCTPDIHLGYRWLFILLPIPFIAYIVHQYALITPIFFPATHYGRELFFCLYQVMFQGIALYLFNQNHKMDYLGNMTLVSIIGALLLLPNLMANHWFDISPIFNLSYFLAVVLIMFVIHWHRMKVINVSYKMSISWLIFRFSIICILFIIH